VDVNEKGTEAAAATAGVMFASGPLLPAPIFRADHPFLFAIRDRKSGAILFLGRLADQTEP
jgi:serpin B